MRSAIGARVLIGIGAATAVVAANIAVPVSAAAPTFHVYPSALSPADIARLSANPTDKVIVLLQNQHPETPGSGGRLAARASVVHADQQHITDELQTLHAPNVHTYSVVNAVSATVSTAEADRLSADPAVLAVVPDAKVQGTSIVTPATSGTSAGPAVDPAPGVCPTDPRKPILEPEALTDMNVPQAHDLGVDGKGVKVAVFPDGLDPNIPDFMRGGSSVIFDYQDFSGEGTAGQTGAAEAFGDVSSIAAQGTQVYDLSKEVNPAHPLPAGCNIRIQGVAPGASVAVMKVFGNQNFAFNSEILQGMEYAVNVDRVDILSQSFGGNPIPNPGLDPIAVFDANAVAAGITVVVSSGDAGTTSTIGTPATNPSVINVGATTNYRLYAQTSSYGYPLGKGGWISNEISAFSSSGIEEYGPRTIDVVAPGEAGWADCSTNTAVFTQCSDIYKGSAPQPIVAFGGTSQSCPLTAGTAALVIEAYRNTHGGATPTPDLVKRIITSTAQDINVRADNQGAGLVDSFRAVQQAMSIHDANGSPAATGQSLLYSTGAFHFSGQPGTSTTFPVTVTNTGTDNQQVSPAVRVLGAATPIASATVAIDQTNDPTFAYQTGTIFHVHTVTFTVPGGLDRLVSRIAWTGNNGTTVRATLFDPLGRIAAHSRPQGSGGGFGEDEIHDPTPGKWTLILFSTAGSYSGPILYTITGAKFHDVSGAVSPASKTIAPGSSATFKVSVTTASAPGDLAEAVAFKASNEGDALHPPAASVPVILRSLVPVGQSHSGNFKGTLTGGNARMAFYGQELVYQFDVPKGVADIDVDVTVGADGYFVYGFLADPQQSPVDVQNNTDAGTGAPIRTLHLSWNNPTPGRWNLDLAQVIGNSSLLTSAPISGTIRFGTVDVGATGVPSSKSTVLAKGVPVQATVHVTNTGNSPEAYSIDPRLNQSGALALNSLGPTFNQPLPINASFPNFFVPSFSSRVDILAQSSVPIDFDTSPSFGYPDVLSTAGTTALASVRNPATSIWSCAPTEFGPFGAGTATATTFTCGAVATTKLFDTAVTSDSGNVWSVFGYGADPSTSYAPLVLQPGQSDDIHVTITPNADKGDVVSGFLGVEAFNVGTNFVAGPFFTFSTDQLVNIPYTYKVG